MEDQKDFEPLVVPPLPEVEFPAEWISEIEAEDPWLAVQVLLRLSYATPIQSLAAVGLLARLSQPRSREEIQRGLSLLRQGHMDPALLRERNWAAESLRGAKAETLERYAMVVVDRLLGEISDLEDSLETNDPDWRRDLLSVLHERDDMEGIRILLREAGVGDILDAGLDRLDGRGVRLVHGISPLEGPSEDEQLRRACSVNPEGWWLYPVTK